MADRMPIVFVSHGAPNKDNRRLYLVSWCSLLESDFYLFLGLDSFSGIKPCRIFSSRCY